MKKSTEEMKKNFEFHCDNLLKWVSQRKDEDIKNYLWRLMMDSNEYAYAKGYQTGRKTGFAEGIRFQFQNEDGGEDK